MIIVRDIPQNLALQYKGAGLALAAINPSGIVIDLRYLSDVDPDLMAKLSDIVEHGHYSIVAQSLPTSEKCTKAAKELAEKGNVSFGLVSCWEFNEL